MLPWTLSLGSILAMVPACAPFTGRRTSAKKDCINLVGLMVNYLYDLDSIEENHDAYFDQGEIVVSRTVAKWLQ